MVPVQLTEPLTHSVSPRARLDVGVLRLTERIFEQRQVWCEPTLLSEVPHQIEPVPAFLEWTGEKRMDLTR